MTLDDAIPDSANANQRQAHDFEWRSFSRFVAVYPVRSGWQVLWGRYEALGAVRKLAGSRVYPDLDGVRGRVLDAVRELTKNDADLVHEADVLMAKTWVPDRAVGALPDPL